MSYASKYGRRPPEYASKATHQNIINDPMVQSFLQQCTLPSAGDADTSKCQTCTVDESGELPIKHIVAIDGGYTEVFVRRDFPSSTIAFFQFGALIFTVEDLEDIARSEFIFPEQMAKLKNIQRLKLTVPTKGLTAYGAGTLTESVRMSLHAFFSHEPSDGPLYESLKWLLFAEYLRAPEDKWKLARCPNPECGAEVDILRSAIAPDFTSTCPRCGATIFLIDVFRLHEVIDNELGAGGVLGYLVVLVEQMLLAHLIKVMLDTKPSLLAECFFLKDGPLGFFGQTANMHKPMRRLVGWLQREHNLYLAGAEKSGPFVEHADAIAKKLQPGTALLLSNEYIYKHIVPGEADPSRPYGSTTYYGSKVIFRTPTAGMFVLTLPTKEVLANPVPADFHNLNVTLRIVSRLRCDMYDNALIPVALVNRLVSLADHPSTRLLEKFAQAKVGRT